MSEHKMEIRFYALGDKPIDPDSGYFPGTENDEEPLNPTLIEVAEQDLGHWLTRPEIDSKFQEILASEIGRRFGQFCVIWHAKIIAIEIPTNDPNAPRKLHWLLDQIEDRVDSAIAKHKQELN